MIPSLHKMGLNELIILKKRSIEDERRSYSIELPQRNRMKVRRSLRTTGGTVSSFRRLNLSLNVESCIILHWLQQNTKVCLNTCFKRSRKSQNKALSLKSFLTDYKRLRVLSYSKSTNISLWMLTCQQFQSQQSISSREAITCNFWNEFIQVWSK